MMARNKNIGTLIGDSIGSVVEVDLLDGEVNWDECVRVRVHLGVSKTLQRGKKIKIGGDEAIWVQFSYERLLDFCYYCGIMGHNHCDCVK